MTETFERIVLASRPVGEPILDNFRLEEHPISQSGSGQMLLRTLWLSLDPYMRGRMSDAPSYAKPVGIGEVMEGSTVSEVVTSNVHRFAKGDAGSPVDLMARDLHLTRGETRTLDLLIKSKGLRGASEDTIIAVDRRPIDTKADP
jgi:NADPH-dependent curcumin reductase CurA